MKLLFKYIPVLVLVVLAAQGCYKDEGNYTYAEAKTVKIAASIPDTVNILLQDTLKVVTQLTALNTDTSAFTYEWILYESVTPLTRYYLGTDHNLTSKIVNAPGRYTLDYFITDGKTGIAYRKSFVINITSVLNEGWIVVEEASGACDMAIILPSGQVYHTVYSGANNGIKLPAGTQRVAVVRDRVGAQKIYVMSPNQGEQLYYANFQKLNSFSSWFYATPAVVKPQEYFIMGGSSERLLNNGQLYSFSTNGPGVPKFGLPPVGTHDIAPYEMYSVRQGCVWYDNLGQRFYKQDESYYDFNDFPAPGSAAVFNPNKIGKKLLFTGATSGSDVYNCLFKNNEDDSLYIYKLELTKTDVGTAIDALGIQPELANAGSYVMSRKLNFLYYTYGNKVYLLDIPAHTSRVIYTFAPGTEIRAMKLYYNSKLTADPDNYNLIAIATNEGGAGKVYQFPLAATGAFAGDTYRNVYTGFGLIHEITFKRAP
ncbi:hypothetical protein HNQ91_000080 [Filimonas zeae]|uniref:PKD-like family protein n=1 Tax=Filimonas zeae TaxID=1737353 RepID=A0A917MRT1_9BACT|nr:PKD-like family lipoprotein [Filimonas zeae]MDR6337058.1 hypothetical protein [Filimonas zeae]GGH56798.1 hypothetical protein GCM10011379_00790 [Filimonas zeae]